MNTIGKFTKADNGYTGSITTLSLDLPAVTLSRITKTSSNSPDFYVYSKRAHIGAGWMATSENGVEYIRLTIDDASLGSPIYASLFFGEDGDAQLVWNRSRKQAA